MEFGKIFSGWQTILLRHTASVIFGDGGVKMVKAYRYAFRLSARLCLRPHSGGYGGASRTLITLVVLRAQWSPERSVDNLWAGRGGLAGEAALDGQLPVPLARVRGLSNALRV